MKTAIVGDIHIKESAIDEIASIFDEIMQTKADRLIQAGDVFDVNGPTPKELKFATELFKKLKEAYKEVIVISGTGEHDVYHDTSIIEYLASLGVTTVRGDYYDEKENFLVGHWMTNESNLAFGTAKHTVSELAKYKFVFLGHLHSYQKIEPNIRHIGAIRYVSWNESHDPYKRIFLYDDNKGLPNQNGHSILEEIALKTPIQMKEIKNIKDLDTLPIKTKIRFSIDNFEQYKIIASDVNRLGKKFVEFKVKLNFEVKQNETAKLECSNVPSGKTTIDSLIEAIADKEVKSILQEQFKKIYDN